MVIVGYFWTLKENTYALPRLWEQQEWGPVWGINCTLLYCFLSFPILRLFHWICLQPCFCFLEKYIIFTGKNLKKKIETEVDSAHITCISCINTSMSVCDSDICHCKDNCETTIAGSQVSKTIEIKILTTTTTNRWECWIFSRPGSVENLE